MTVGGDGLHGPWRGGGFSRHLGRVKPPLPSGGKEGKVLSCRGLGNLRILRRASCRSSVWLEPGTIPRGALWVEGVNAPTADITLADIRESARRDRPSGRRDGRWRRRMLWVWEYSLRPRGCPRVEPEGPVDADRVSRRAETMEYPFTHHFGSRTGRREPYGRRAGSPCDLPKNLEKLSRYAEYTWGEKTRGFGPSAFPKLQTWYIL